jgi:hypothetical protein
VEREAGGTELKERAMCAPAYGMDAINALPDELRMAHVREESALGELEATNCELETTNARLAVAERELAEWRTGGRLCEAQATARMFADSLRDADAVIAEVHGLLSDDARTSALPATQLSEARAELAQAHAKFASTQAELVGMRARVAEAESAEPVQAAQHLLSATVDLAAQQLHNKEIVERRHGMLKARHQYADVFVQRYMAQLIGDGESDGFCGDAMAFTHQTNGR